MIEKESLLKALGTTLICLALGALCALAPHQRPFMKSFFALASLLFLGSAALALPSLRKQPFYWSMLVIWSSLQAFIFFSWVVERPIITSLAWAITPCAYTALACLIVATIHKAPALTPRQRMLFIMSIFLGSMHLLLGSTYALKSVIVYFIALVVFPVNVYEFFHEPSEAGSRIGHKVTTTLFGISMAFYLLDSIGTIIISIDGLQYQSLYHLLEGSGSFTGAPLSIQYPHVAEALAYSGVFIGVFMLIYLVWAVLPRACCARQSHEDIF